MSLRPLSEVVESPSGWDSTANYIGQSEFPGWYCVVTQTRDSDCLSRSNWRSALALLGGEGNNVVIHRFGHWACGWWEALAVLEGTPEYTKAVMLSERLDGYPVVDDDDFSACEHEEAEEVWRNCYNPHERIAYIRKHDNQFEFHSFADLMGCVRGKYFAGAPSELIQ